jgi:hypothetical protein
MKNTIKNLTVKEIIENTKSQLEQSIETIKNLHELINEPIGTADYVTETDMLIYDMEQSIERLSTININKLTRTNYNYTIPLIKIKTKFGDIYIEKLFDEREEVDRIKIYDSNKNYMDYFDLEHLQNCANEMHCSLKEEYNTRIHNFINASTIHDLALLIYSYEDFEIVKGNNWTKGAECLGLDLNNMSQAAYDFFNNEYVNRIGDYYVILSD